MSTPTPAPAARPAAGERFALVVRVLPGDVPGIQRLRLAFKLLLRRCGVRIESAEPLKPEGRA